jgi:hypothetical protein
MYQFVKTGQYVSGNELKQFWIAINVCDSRLSALNIVLSETWLSCLKKLGKKITEVYTELKG